MELIGRLGADPESRYLNDGTPVANFRIATSYTSTKDGETRTETEWTPIVAWRGLAEVCMTHLVKGSRVRVAGRLRTRSWEDDGGQRHYRTEVIASDVLFLDRRGQDAAESLPEEELPDA